MTTAEQILKLLEEHVNVLMYGPPGTGKSHLMVEVQRLFHQKYQGSTAGTRFGIDTSEERKSITVIPSGSAHSRWVTFHQGYSYEDFVIGLRPAAEAGGGGLSLSLEAQPGALLELAALSKCGHGLMLIDEINRGNASRIFGEFITLLEPSKRLAPDGKPKKSTVSVTLPYVKAGQKVMVTPGAVIEREFQMPAQVFTLASMNSVDKSVAPLDAAIRRRFYVLHLRPSNDDVYAASGADKSPHQVGLLASKVIEKLNRGIGIFLGPDYMLGQFYLPSEPKLGEMDERTAKAAFAAVWRHKLLPQLIEYFHSRPAVCKNLLEFDNLGSGSGLGVVAPSATEQDEGATEFVLNQSQDMSDQELLTFLEKFGGVALSHDATSGAATPSASNPTVVAATAEAVDGATGGSGTEPNP